MYSEMRSFQDNNERNNFFFKLIYSKFIYNKSKIWHNACKMKNFENFFPPDFYTTGSIYVMTPNFDFWFRSTRCHRSQKNILLLLKCMSFCIN